MFALREEERLTAQAKNELIEQGYITAPDSARGRLLQAAAKLFKHKGFDRTTVRDLAREIGIQSGSLFHHFKNKEQILKAVMEESILFNTHRMKLALEGVESGEAALLVLIQCELEAVNGVTGDAMNVLVDEWRALSEDAQNDILKLRDVYESIWLTHLTTAFEQNKLVGDPLLMRRLVLGSISWTHNWFRKGGELSIEQLAQQILKTLIRSKTGESK